MAGPYRGKLLEFSETVLARLPEVGKGSGNPALKLADRWKSAVLLGKSDLADEHVVRTDEGVVYARSIRRLVQHSWSEKNLPAVVETPQKPKTTIAEIPLAAEPLTLPREPQETLEDEKRENKRTGGRRRNVRWSPVDMEETQEAPSSSRGDKRTETQRKCGSEEKADDEITQKTDTPVVLPADDPVKRRLLKKTDLKSDDVLMPVEIEDTDLLCTVNTLQNDENGEAEEPWSEETQRTKILSVLDDHEEMMKERTKELNSLL